MVVLKSCLNPGGVYVDVEDPEQVNEGGLEALRTSADGANIVQVPPAQRPIGLQNFRAFKEESEGDPSENSFQLLDPL